MFSQIVHTQFVYTQEYFYGVSLVVAAVVNFVLAGLLLFDSNNYLYTETPRYLRSRRFTGLSLAVFGVGFLLHWWFLPHFTHRLTASALSLSYFHMGGVLFSMSHTGLIDRHYFTRQVVVRDVVLLLISLCVYWCSAWFDVRALSYVGFSLFFLHVGYLTFLFYRSFYRIYHQLGDYAEYLPNDTDKEVRWLVNSCHIIILFGIGSIVFTLVFQHYTLPFTLLLFVSILVFTYIYKALDNFSVVACEAERNLQQSEEYQHMAQQPVEAEPSAHVTPEASYDIDKRIEQWVAGRYYTDPKLTIHDALSQMDISMNALNYYLETHTTVRGYRQWLPCLRIEEAKRLMLQHPHYTFQTIAEACGYATSGTLARSFKSQEGISPVEWLNANLPEEA